MRQYTFAQMRKASQQNDKHWFDTGAINFFNTVFETEPNKFNFFITSERMELNFSKKYSIRWFNSKNSKIYTIGEFRQFETIKEAEQIRSIITVACHSFANRECDIMENLCEVLFEKQRIIFKACYSLKDSFEYKFFAINYEGKIIN